MNDFVLPETRYAQSGEVSIAYQVIGDGPIDMIVVPGLFSHIEFMHELSGYTAFLRRLSAFARVVTFDKRGQGLSDRMSGAPSLEQRMDDVRALMDTIGSRRAILMGFSEGCAMSALFAATYPDRVSHLILISGFARSADRMSEDMWPMRLEELVKNWGTGLLIKTAIPAREVCQRRSPGSRSSNDCPVVRVLSGRSLHSIADRCHGRSCQPCRRRLSCSTDAVIARCRSRWVASWRSQFPAPRFVEYPDGDHVFWTGDTEAVMGDIEEFVTGHRDSAAAELERVLATVLFTDIVDSTRSAAAMGDQRWRRMLDNHDQLARRVIDRHRGNLIKRTGDGVLATFDGPGRAVRCALAFGSAVRQIGLPVRAGLHTGEIEVRGRDIGGIAVHAAARVMGHCGSDEVLVSRVITDLVAGAGLKFADRGSHELKGLPGRWDLFAASL